MRAMRAAALALVGAGLAGCYGSTEKATDVDLDSAVLRGHGTSNSGPAETFFEYWPTATPASKSTTPTINVPGGVSGPIVRRVTGLQQGTPYSFRICGKDVSAPAALCAQVRTFETQSPDRATGTGSATPPAGPIVAVLNARSGPSGESASGSLEINALINSQVSTFNGSMNCLSTNGGTAIISATGNVTGGTPGGPFTVSARIVEAAPGQPGTLDYRVEPANPNPTCALYLLGGTILTGDFEVTDSQPPPPPS